MLVGSMIVSQNVMSYKTVGRILELGAAEAMPSDASTMVGLSPNDSGSEHAFRSLRAEVATRKQRNTCTRSRVSRSST